MQTHKPNKVLANMAKQIEQTKSFPFGQFSSCRLTIFAQKDGN